MNELLSPRQIVLQTALTPLVDAVCAYFHAASLSHSSLLMQTCAELANERKVHSDRVAELIQLDGGRADLESSREARFQRIWMALVNRRFETFREGLPRECLRVDRRAAKALVRACRAEGLAESERKNLRRVLAEVRRGMARMERLRDPGQLLPAFAS